MSALATYLFSKGYLVRGSDSAESERSKALEKIGIEVNYFPNEKNIGEENVVVYSSAIKESHIEFAEARRRGKLLLSRAELLNLVGARFTHAVYVAGSHGKTTTTAMLAHIFSAAGKKFTLHLGGEDYSFGNFYSSGEDFFLSEACEYQKNILSLYGETAVVLNTDLDHGECYSSKEELLFTYATFLSRAQNKITSYGAFPSSYSLNAETFSLQNGEYTAEILSSEGEKYSFLWKERKKEMGKISLQVVGKHQILNALAAAAVARKYEIAAEEIRAGLESFRGVKRRFEEVGTFLGAKVVCDYAHHPEEIAANVRSAEKLYSQVTILFQPHTYSRTRILFDDFVAALQNKRVCLLPTYPARETFDAAGDASRLAYALGAPYAKTEEEIKEFLKNNPSECILVLGAGDIYEKIKTLLRN